MRGKAICTTCVVSWNVEDRHTCFDHNPDTVIKLPHVYTYLSIDPTVAPTTDTAPSVCHSLLPLYPPLTDTISTTSPSTVHNLSPSTPTTHPPALSSSLPTDTPPTDTSSFTSPSVPPIDISPILTLSISTPDIIDTAQDLHPSPVVPNAPPTDTNADK